MTPNSPDSHKISLKIIEAIRQHPVLYISEVKGNAIKLQEFRQKVWKRISDELGLDSGWVKLKWKNLRDTYCRILKYKNKSSKGIRRKKWIFEDQLSFLRFPYEPDYEAQYVELTEEYINDINTEIINPQDILEQLEDEDDNDYSEYLEILEDNSSEETNVQETLDSNNDHFSSDNNDNQRLQKLAIDAYAKQIQSKYRKIRPKKVKLEDSSGSANVLTPFFVNTAAIVPINKPAVCNNNLNVQKYTKEILHTSFDHKNSVDQFFNSIAHTVKKLPPKAQADIKMEICKIVSEAEIRCSRQRNLPNTQKYSSLPGMIPKLVLVPCHMIDNSNKQVI